jgi:hypothetical protein
MPGVHWANQATRDAYDALISQPEAIHIPCTRRPDESEGDFADRLRTITSALDRAIHDFGLDGPMRAWLGRVSDWSAVDWAQVAAQLSYSTDETPSRAHIEENGPPAVAA